MNGEHTTKTKSTKKHAPVRLDRQRHVDVAQDEVEQTADGPRHVLLLQVQGVRLVLLQLGTKSRHVSIRDGPGPQRAGAARLRERRRPPHREGKAKP